MKVVSTETARLEALHDLRILDVAGGPELDELVGLVSDLCNTPIAAISLVDKNRQWFKSSRGLAVDQTPRDIAFCSHAIEQRGLFVVRDATADVRFQNNPLVANDPHVRFYAGLPLVVQGGHSIGTLCVIDNKARDLDPLQIRTLEVIGKIITQMLERESNEMRRQKVEKLLDIKKLATAGTAKMSALGEMAAGIAHEINNPLAVIVGRAGTLIDLAESDRLNADQVKVAAQSIETTCLRISKTIRSLGAFARDGEKDELQFVPVAALISDTLELCRERFKTHGVELRIDVPSSALSVQCRSVQITQVMVNLLNNAFDAVAGLSSERWVVISVTQKNEICEISVSNGGPTIPDDIRERIMQPFFTTKPPGKGTGLGLSISQRILDSHESVLELDPSARHTRFSFKLKVLPN
jgi:two-component system, NtrC family, sensor kinase